MKATLFCKIMLTPQPDSLGFHHMSVISLVDVEAWAAPSHSPRTITDRARSTRFIFFTPWVRKGSRADHRAEVAVGVADDPAFNSGCWAAMVREWLEQCKHAY